MTDALLAALEEEGLDVQPARDIAGVNGWLHSGNYALNYVMSGRLQRGYPLGHAVEIYGDPSTGKSYLVKRAIAQAQREGGSALIDDTEGAFSPDWAERCLGVDVDALGLKKSDTVEDHERVCQTFLAAVARLVDGEDDPPPYVLALDSLAWLSTKKEMDEDAEIEADDMRGARRAKILRRLFSNMAKSVSDLPVLYLATNHKIANIGQMFGPNKTSPGGSGPKFQSSVRLDLRAPKKIKDDDDVIGVRIRVVVSKNRLAPPFRESIMTIPYERSISPYSGLISLLIDRGFLDTTDGHNVKYQGEDTGIKAQVTNPLKQDRSAEKLVEEYPDILDEADEYFAEQQAQAALQGE